MFMADLLLQYDNGPDDLSTISPISLNASGVARVPHPRQGSAVGVVISGRVCKFVI